MSLEAALAENTAAVRELIAKLGDIDTNQQRLLAVADKADAPAAKRATRKKADEKPAEVVEEKQPEPEAPAEPEITTGDAVKQFALDWINELDKGTDGRKERGDFVLEIQKHFDVKLGELKDADQIKQIVFLLKRKIAGLDVTLGAEYDYSGAVDQEEPESEDEFG